MEWINSIQGFLGAIPVALLLVFFIKYTLSGLHARIDSKVAKEVYNIQVKGIEEDISAMNGEVKESFDKLIEKADEQTKANGDVKVELAKLNQRVDDLLKNGIAKG